MARFAIEPAGQGRLAASGELTFESAAEALQAGSDRLRSGGSWVIDLSRVESGDSAGLAVLVDWLAETRSRGGSLRYEAVPAQMLAIARISDLEGLLLGR